jgi:outer membrane protein
MKFPHFSFDFFRLCSAISALLLASTALAQAPATNGLDLLTAWQMAKVRDGTLAAAKYQELAVKQRMVQAQLALGPSASASGSVLKQWTESNNEPSKQFNSANFSLSLSYPLYRLPAKESWEQSKVVVEQSKIQVLAAEQELMIKVVQAYMDVLGAQDTLRAAQAQKRAAREQMLTLKRSFEAGNAARIDLQDSIARHDISQAQEITARNDLDVKRSNIQVITGSLEPELRRLKPEIGLSLDSSYNVSDWVRQARTANTQVLISELGLELAQREVRKQGSANRPTIDLVSSIGRSNNPSVNLVGVNQTNAQVGIQLSIPIFTNGGFDAKSKEAVALYNKSSAELEVARDQVEQLTRQASVRIASGRALIAALESAVESSQIALDTTVLAFNTGARVNLDVLNAQQQVFAQKRDLAKARYDFLVDSLRLKLLSGSLSEADLSTFNQLLIPLTSTR